MRAAKRRARIFFAFRMIDRLHTGIEAEKVTKLPRRNDHLRNNMPSQNKHNLLNKWWVWLDSNQQPRDYESTMIHININAYVFYVPQKG